MRPEPSIRRTPCPATFFRSLLFPALLAGLSGPVVGQGYVLWELEGQNAGGGFGTSVSRAGDVDGDGLSDLLVGAPQAGIGGEAYVLSGGTGRVLHTFRGRNTGDDFGTSVACAGDVDGDGFDDLLVGAPRAGQGGEATLFSGASGAILHAPIPATAPGDQCGKAVGCAGDVDRDGVPDVIVGSPGASPAGRARGGEARVFSGATWALLHTFQGMAPDTQLGSAVDAAGDFDNDGWSDLVVGAPCFTYPATRTGFVVVYSGATGMSLHSVGGFTVGDLFGATVAGVGDLDQDNYDDVAVGARWSFQQNQGAVLVVSGRTGGWLFFGTGNNAFDTYGTSVAGPGDVDGDGRPDLVLGAPQPTGSAPGYVEVFDVFTGNRLLRSTGRSLDAWFGYVVAGAGDVDGDGLPDVVAGAPRDDPGGRQDAGTVTVFSAAGPPGSRSFGSGCPGSGGLQPAIATLGGLPTASGNPNFSMAIHHALGAAPVALFSGLSSQSWNGISLPLDLGLIGLPGCWLLVSQELLLTSLSSGAGPGGGSANFPLPIPRAPYLFPAQVYFQGYVLDPGGSGTLPGALTRGLQLQFVR